MTEDATKRVLVCTNDWCHFTGSEIVALEVAEWFKALGHSVVLCGVSISDFFRFYLSDKFPIINFYQCCNFHDYDIVWSQHNVAALFYAQLLSSGKIPLLINVSLSPYEPIESADVVLSERLQLPLYFNSQETFNKILDTRRESIAATIFQNAAPRAFWGRKYCRTYDLTKIAVVSNHIPRELHTALWMLKLLGREIRVYGMSYNFQRLAPADLEWADAIVSIGKTVPYGIALGRPVYMYDRFGGDGWLSDQNFKSCAAYNFSGRPRCRKLEPINLVSEILEGFQDAAIAAERFYSIENPDLFKLDTHLVNVLSLASDPVYSYNLQVRFTESLSDWRFVHHLKTFASLRRAHADVYRKAALK